MSKWLGVAGISGIALAGFFFFSNHSSLNSVQHAVESFLEEVTSVEEVEVTSVDLGNKSTGYVPSSMNNEKLFKKIISQALEVELGKDQLYGEILSQQFSASSSNASYLSALEDVQEVKTFVVVSEVYDLDRDYYLSEWGFKTPFGKMENDEALLNKLVSGEEIFEYGKEPTELINNDVFIPNPVSALLKYYFPNSEVVLLALNPDISEKSVDTLISKLSDEEDVFVISLSNQVRAGGNKWVSSFKDQFTSNIVQSLDYEAISQTSFRGKVAAGFLFKYLENKGVEAATERDLHILSFGDMMLGRHVRTLMDSNGGKDYVFENIIGEWGKAFNGADIIHGNLEGPISGEGKKGGTAMNFAFNVDVAPFLKESGFNLLSLANNHATDQGWEGRDTTIEALDSANVGWCGHPSEADPESVYYGEVDEKTFAFICLHDVSFTLDVPAAVKLIEEVSQEVDFAIVSIHWGYEYKHTADYNKQVKPARSFIDAGADFVIGHHPHVVQNFEIYNDRFIFYSLGNFVFDQYWSTMTQEELAIGIVLSSNEDDFASKVYLFPMKSESSQSRLMNADERASWTDAFMTYGEYDDETLRMIREGVLQITP
jgi:hypothetical protein